MVTLLLDPFTFIDGKCTLLLKLRIFSHDGILVNFCKALNAKTIYRCILKVEKLNVNSVYLNITGVFKIYLLFLYYTGLNLCIRLDWPLGSLLE